MAGGRLDARAVVQTAGLTAISSAGVIFCPLWILLLSPIILGAPHVASDIRYLVLRPVYGRSWKEIAWVLAPIGALLLLGILAAFGWPRHVEVEIGLGMAACGIAVLAGGSAISEGAKTALLCGLIAVSTFLISHPRPTIVALLHLHNLIGLGIWYTLFRQAGTARSGRNIVLIFAGGLAACAGAALIFPDLTRFGPAPHGFGLAEAGNALLPGAPLLISAIVIRAYAFLQLMHYVIWLFLVPQSGERTLIQDFGRGGISLIVLISAAVIAAGYFLPVRTRELYLTVSSFHAWLEIGAASYLFAAGAARSNKDWQTKIGKTKVGETSA